MKEFELILSLIITQNHLLTCLDISVRPLSAAVWVLSRLLDFQQLGPCLSTFSNLHEKGVRRQTMADLQNWPDLLWQPILSTLSFLEIDWIRRSAFVNRKRQEALEFFQHCLHIVQLGKKQPCRGGTDKQGDSWQGNPEPHCISNTNSVP